MNKLYSFGEVLIDFFPIDRDTSLQDATSFAKHPGGAPANVAFSFARLGGEASFIGAVGNDSFGQFLQHTLKRQGVGIEHLSLENGAQTPLAFVGIDHNKKRTFEFFRGHATESAVSPQHINKLSFDSSDILHFSSNLLADELSKQTTDALIQKAKQNGTLIHFDPSIRLLFWPDEKKLRQTVFDYMKQADIVKFNEEEFEFLYGKNADTQNIIHNILKTTIMLVITHGQQGATAYTRTTTIESKAPKVTTVDTTGAGDAFVSGLLYMGSHLGFSLKEALQDATNIRTMLEFANVNAALSTTKKGSMLSLPSREEVDNMIQSNDNNKKSIAQGLIEKAKTDAHRLKYHIMPEGGWLNDPNGLIQYKGQYHAFFQHHPYSPEWGPMHWGHVVSDDLLHWTYCPIALTPDEKGCFSGSAVDDNGILTLIYTGHDDTGSPKEVQCIATSEDGIHFDKYEKNPVIGEIPPDGSEDFRDPKVFYANNCWNMVVGTSTKGQGCIVGYTSNDLRSWTYKGIVCQATGKQGDMWECPDLFDINGEYFLLASPMNMKDAKSIFLYGNFDVNSFRFAQTSWEHIDYGFEFYAPQTLKDDQGRRILIGWMDMWSGEFPTQKEGWAGALTLPRELTVVNNRIHQNPVVETETLRNGILHEGSLVLSDGQHGQLPSVKGDCMEWIVEAAFEDPKAELFIELRASSDFKEKTTIHYQAQDKLLTINKKNSGIKGKKNTVEIPIVSETNNLKLHLFLDQSSLEVFVNNGAYVASNRIFPQTDSINADIYALNGNVNISSLKIYQLEV